MSFTDSIRRKCSYPFCKHDCGLPWQFLPFRVEVFLLDQYCGETGQFCPDERPSVLQLQSCKQMGAFIIEKPVCTGRG